MTDDAKLLKVLVGPRSARELDELAEQHGLSNTTVAAVLIAMALDTRYDRSTRFSFDKDGKLLGLAEPFGNE